MALDVWIGKPTNSKSKLVTSFDPEAYYWFLYPLFEEFAQIHGQMIDLYDGAIFEPTELTPLLRLVDEAKALVSAQPEEFEIYIGTTLGSALEPKNEKNYHTVQRDDYLTFIENLRSAIHKSQQVNKPLLFFGD